MKGSRVAIVGLLVAALAFLVGRMSAPRGSEPATRAIGPDRSAERREPDRSPALSAAEPQSARVRVEPGEVATPPAPPTAAGERADLVFVYGSITGSDGNVPTDGELRFEAEDGPAFRSPLRGEPHFSVAGLRPGPLVIRALDCTGYYPLERTVVLAPGQEAQRVDLELQAAVRLGIRLRTSAGKPFRGASEKRVYFGMAHCPTVIATRSAPELRLRPSEARYRKCYGIGQYASAAHGDAATPAGAPPDWAGWLELDEPPPAYVSLVAADLVLETRRIDGTESEIVFVVDVERLETQLATVRFRVLDGVTGQPDVGISASLLPVEHPTVTAGVTFEPSGVAVFENVVPGASVLTIRNKQLHTIQARVDVRPGTVHELGDYTFGPDSGRVGHVSDESGQPVSVRIVSEDEADGGRAGVRRSFVSFTDGMFVLEGAPSAWLVQIDDPRFARNVLQISPPLTETEKVKLIARSGTAVAIRLLGSAGEHRDVVVEDGAGRIVWRELGAGTRSYDLRLLPGSYRARAQGDTGVERETAFEVGDNQPTRIEVP